MKVSLSVSIMQAVFVGYIKIIISRLQSAQYPHFTSEYFLPVDKNKKWKIGGESS